MSDQSVSESPEVTPVDHASQRVLIVDDNQQNVELLQAYLEPLGCHTVVAHDGQEALEYLENNRQPEAQIDLILLDVMMPRMSGFEACRKIKENPELHNIPVMMVTALNAVGDIERGMDAGTDEFISKPVNRIELITRVKTLLRLRWVTKLAAQNKGDSDG